MIKLIIFDLDGVLVEAKKIHYDSLNDALEEKYKISWDEHLTKYDGLKTNQKLELLTKEKNLPTQEYEKIWKLKQKNTLISLSKLSPSDSLRNTIEKISLSGLKIAVCSNSIRKTV